MMAFGTPPSVGLDIGTTAVRAAQVSGARGGRTLTSFAQVPLPPGAVVDGEIRDEGVVSEAIAQLWKRAKIRSKRVVLGVANQRVVVRQIDLPFLEEKEFKSSLQFQVADHIPMAVEDAELDYEVLEEYESENGERMMRVLLIAAATDMVEGFVSTAAAAGLDPAGVDLTPFAVARAVSGVARGDHGAQGAEAIVDIGGGTTSIVVHDGGEPRFVRILLVGGDSATEALAQSAGVSTEEAEALKLDLAGDSNSPLGRVFSEQIDRLVGEIRGSLDYFASQEEGAPVSMVHVTGGGSMATGLIPRLQQVVSAQVIPADPFAELKTSKSGLTEQQLRQIAPVAAAAIGLAMGDRDS